jgi:ABC-type Na+ efflux pump permease subunit
MSSSYFTFALVTLLIALILIAFAIANIVYFNQFKNGVALTQSQLTGLVVINAIAIILLLILFFYGIFAAVRARKVSDLLSSSAPAAVVAPASYVVGPQAAAAAAAGVPVVPVASAAPPLSLPKNTTLVGAAREGTQLFRVNRTTTVSPGQFLCVPPQ